MNTNLDYLVFRIDERFFAVDVFHVSRVLRSVALVDVPGAPFFLQGLINIRGDIVPVLNLRSLFGLPGKAVELDDRMLLLGNQSRDLCVAVDGIEGVFEFSSELIEEPGRFGLQNDHCVRGAVRFRTDTALILDPGWLLPRADLERLEETLSSQD
jgi:purine-binding chemotaxis protein CheW